LAITTAGCLSVTNMCSADPRSSAATYVGANSCNLCHYHKSDKPDELLDILKQVRISGKDRKLFH
jgi:hypothetical protein